MPGVLAALRKRGSRMRLRPLWVSGAVLLLAGYGGAAFLENGQWTVLYSTAEMTRAARQAASQESS